MGYADANGKGHLPSVWEEARILTPRVKLDALDFKLYGTFDSADAAASRDVVRYIYSTFPIIAAPGAEKWAASKAKNSASPGSTR